MLARSVDDARRTIVELRRRRADEWEITAQALTLWQSIASLTGDDERLRRYAFDEFDRMLQDERICPRRAGASLRACRPPRRSPAR